MDQNVKNSLVMAGSALAGGYGGSWIAGRLCTAMNCTLGPWGTAIGAVLGAMATTAVAKSMMGDAQAFPEFDAAMESAEAMVDDTVKATKNLYEDRLCSVVIFPSAQSTKMYRRLRSVRIAIQA